MRFADIPGHEEAKARLVEMADRDRIPNALLIEGPEGAGKFALARAFAQYVHCDNRSNGDSCGVCPSCRKHEAFNSLETIYSFPVVKRKGGRETISDDWFDEFKSFVNENPFMNFDGWLESLDNINAQPHMFVEESRELIRKLAYKSRTDKYKLVLMWLPERLNEDAANRLLKIVEEPFADTRFIMVSNNSRLILPTIFSRTQRISVPAFDDDAIVSILQARGIDDATASEAARIAEGSVNRAIRMAGLDEERRRFLGLFADLMRKAYARQVADLRNWTKEVAELGREGEMRFIDYCSRLVRESFLMHLQVDGLLSMTRDERTFVTRFFPFINEKNVIEMVGEFDRTKRDIAANGNPRIVLFDTALKIIMLIRRK